MALLSEQIFFEQRALDALFWKPFNVGIFGGTEITGAKPDHISGSTGADNGAIPRLRRIRKAKRTHGKSDDIGALFDWTTMAQPRFIHLLGHGASGLFEVGDGQQQITEAGCLRSYNRSYWESHLARTSKYDENRQVKVPAEDVYYSGGLMLEGCCVAEGARGVRFMKQVADATLRSVFAYTGLITVRDSSVWFQKGHAWIRHDPLASSPTVEVRQLDKSLVRRGSLGATGLGDGVEPEDLEALEVTSALHGGRTIRFTGEPAAELLKQLLYSNGFKAEGEPAGIVTQRIKAIYAARTPLIVTLYAGRMAMTDTGIAYLVGPDLDRLIDMYFEA